MRFVVPDTKRIDLRDGPGGEKNWIEVKLELTKGEDSKFRTRAMRAQVTPGQGNVNVEIDWEKLALARVETYLVDWSAKDAKGKDIPVTANAIAALATEDFDEIDQAIQDHIAALEAEKKLSSGNGSPTTT